MNTSTKLKQLTRQQWKVMAYLVEAPYDLGIPNSVLPRIKKEEGMKEAIASLVQQGLVKEGTDGLQITDLEVYKACKVWTGGSSTNLDLNILATIKIRAGDPQKALLYKEEVLKIYRKRLEKEANPNWLTDSQLAYLFRSCGELCDHVGANKEGKERQEYYKKALDYQQKALAMFLLGIIEMMQDKNPKDQQKLQDYQKEAARCLTGLGISEENLGNLQQALAYKKKALEMEKTLASGDDIGVAHKLHNVGVTLIQFKDPAKVQEGIEDCKKALAMRERLYKGEDQYSIIQSQYGIAGGYIALKNYPEAKTHLQLAMEMALRLFRKEHHELDQCARYLAQLDQQTAQKLKEELKAYCDTIAENKEEAQRLKDLIK